MWIKGWRYWVRHSAVRIAEPLRNEDCSTANLRTRQTGWYSVKKHLCTVGKDAKCNMQICFHLWQSVNENKWVTAVRVPTKVIDENYGIHDVWEFRRKIKLLKRWCYRPLRELHTKFPGFNRCLAKWKSPPNEPLVSAGWNALHSA